MKRWRGLCIGAGYFSQFHLDAWQRMPDVEIVAICDRDSRRVESVANRFGITACCDAREALQRWKFDFVDLIVPPGSQRELIELVATSDRAIICQKPFATDLAEARELALLSEERGCRIMVHENFRFQPWHREIRRLLDSSAIGDRLHALTFRSRLGDGWGDEAYLDRQPYFRDLSRFLIRETGVHFIDTFRYLAGEVNDVYSRMRRLNSSIAGEDAALLILEFQNGAVGVWDANRYNESTAADPRYTFGEFLVEGNGGAIRLYPDGRLTIQIMGQPECEHAYSHSSDHFGGGCVEATQRHFIDCLREERPFETNVREYLKTLAVVEAAYQSADEHRPVPVQARSQALPGNARSRGSAS